MADRARQVHAGMCDASASVLADDNHFLVANDEDNVLRLYRLDASDGPVACFDWSGPLGIAPDEESPEADIEAAARVGDRAYWVTSHGASRKGKKRPNRRRFFATDLVVANGRVDVVPAGTPYRRLLDDLCADPRLADFRLDKRAKESPESADGLNIEGLAAAPGGRLLIGFRNPIPGGKALLVPLENPDQLLAGAGPAVFGDPILVDLGGLGVRSIDWSEAHEAYFVVAGPFADGGAARLFRWSGAAGDAAVPVPQADLAGLNPEAVVAPPAPRTDLLILSDDGGRKRRGVACKDAPPGKRRFLSAWVTP